MKVVRKAVFPVAGLGTRFLPATKANPKEMLPIVDKPLIQYAVEEAIAAGITELIFVTSNSKRAIEDHFDTNFELEFALQAQGKYQLLNTVRNIVPEGVACIYVRQAQPRGLGHAVLCAKEVIGDEPFAVLLADDLIVNSGQPCLQQMLSIFDETNQSVVAVQQMAREELAHYGVVEVEEPWQGAGSILSIVEKPDPKVAPSDLGVVGRYVLQPEILDILSALPPGASNEIQLTDAISQHIKLNNAMALEFSGQRYDCGNKLGYLKAVMRLGLQHPELGQSLNNYLNTLLKPKEGVLLPKESMSI